MMAGDWTEWADGSDLGDLSRSTAPLAKMGYDADDLRTNPQMRSEAMDRVQGPYAPDSRSSSDQAQANAQSAQMAQNQPPANPATPDPRMAAPEGEPPNPVLRQRTGAAPPASSAQPGSQQQQPAPPVQSPQASAANPAKPAATPPWQSLAQQGVVGELGIAGENKATYEGLPNAPDTSTLDTRIETESMPTNPRATDPLTGKPMYKQTALGQVGRVFSNMAKGAAGDLNQVTPYSAPNKTYQEDEQLRQGLLANDQQKKADLIARFKAASDQAEARAKGLQTIEPDYQHAAQQATAAQNAQTDETKEVNRAQEASPQGKAAVTAADEKAKFDAWDGQANRLGLKGENAIFFRANGKLYDPRQATGEEIARAQALKAWYGDPANRNRQPSLDDLNQINAAASGRLKDESGGDTPSDAVQAAARGAMADITAYTSQWARQPDGSYRTTTPGKFESLKGDEYEAKVNKLREDANKQMAKKGWVIDQNGQLVKAPEAGKDPTPPAGATHVYRDPKTKKVAGWAVGNKFVPVTAGAAQ